MRGRGTGVHDGTRFLGLPIWPAKDALLVLVPVDVPEAVLDAVAEARELDQPGHGIVFLLDVPGVAGSVHQGDVLRKGGTRDEVQARPMRGARSPRERCTTEAGAYR